MRRNDATSVENMDMWNDETPERLIAVLLDMRATLEPSDARARTQACLAGRGQPFDEELWAPFFDPEESFADAMYGAATALWGLVNQDVRYADAQVALLAFEVAKDAGCVVAAFALADCLDWLGDERAEAALREFVTLHPDWEDPRLFGILGGLVADAYDDEAHLHEALGFLEHAGDADPLWVCWRALAVAKLGRRDEAIVLLQDQIVDGDRDALRVLGDIHRAVGDMPSAQDAYLRAVAVGDDVSARRLGIVFREAGDDHAATQAFVLAAERGDRHAGTELNDAGWLLRQDGRMDEAVVRFRLAWESGDRDSGHDLATTLEEAGRLGEARAIWKSLADTGDVSAMIEFGEWAASDRDVSEARLCFLRAMELGTAEQRAIAAAHLGLTYDVGVASNHADARELLELGAPLMPAARAALGWLHAKGGRPAEAEITWRSGMHDNETESIASLGAWGLQNSDPVSALVLVEQALEAGDGILAYNIGSQLAEVGEDAVAARFMARAVELSADEDAKVWLETHAQLG